MANVYIIGAGASNEVGLPVGDEFKKEIASLLDIQIDIIQRSGDKKIVEALRIHIEHPTSVVDVFDAYLNSAWHIRDALPLAKSIDGFVDSQRGNDMIALCGKLAIVRSILKAEKTSSLYLDLDKSIDFESLNKTWYGHFYKLLTNDSPKGNLAERFRSIVMIIFNYDRCLEHFLYHALLKYYQMSSNEAAGLVQQIKIYHPYGSVGPLAWCSGNGTMGFGDDPDPKKLLELAKKIRTFSEETDSESGDLLAMKNAMLGADKLVFLGFAFHDINMKLLSCAEVGERSQKILKTYATAYCCSESDKEKIRRQIRQLYKSNMPANHQIAIKSIKCIDFMNEFGRSLAF